jgi:hypothetical protein
MKQVIEGKMEEGIKIVLEILLWVVYMLQQEPGLKKATL